MTCKACKERGQTWNGSPPKCAFEEGHFSRENWNCATANAIRDLVYEGQNPMPEGVDYRYCEDQKYATVHVADIDGPGPALALWVSWYKSRGGTDAMWLLEEYSEPRQPTEADCLAILAAYGRTPGPADG
jgi:hypothetical protein